MTKAMYEDLLERNRLQISELNTLTEEQDKHITDLAKENAELRTVKIPQLERKIASIRGAHSVDCKKLNARIEQVERLKNENTELKKVNNKLTKKCDCLTECNDGLQDLLDNNIDVLEKLVQLQKENAKAKELLREMIATPVFCQMGGEAYENELYTELVTEAEQFLKEVSE